MRISTNQIKFSELYVEALEVNEQNENDERKKCGERARAGQEKMKITNGKDKFKENCRSFSYKDSFSFVQLSSVQRFVCFVFFSRYLYFVSFCMCACVSLHLLTLNIFFRSFVHHIERKCKIFLLRFYLNVAFGIFILDKGNSVWQNEYILSYFFYISQSLPYFALNQSKRSLTLLSISFVQWTKRYVNNKRKVLIRFVIDFVRSSFSNVYTYKMKKEVKFVWPISNV